MTRSEAGRNSPYFNESSQKEKQGGTFKRIASVIELREAEVRVYFVRLDVIVHTRTRSIYMNRF